MLIAVTELGIDWVYICSDESNFRKLTMVNRGSKSKAKDCTAPSLPVFQIHIKKIGILSRSGMCGNEQDWVHGLYKWVIIVRLYTVTIAMKWIAGFLWVSFFKLQKRSPTKRGLYPPPPYDFTVPFLAFLLYRL